MGRERGHLQGLHSQLRRRGAAFCEQGRRGRECAGQFVAKLLDLEEQPAGVDVQPVMAVAQRRSDRIA